MSLNSIRIKIIGGYILFVVLILSFLGLNYLLAASTARRTERVYQAGEWIRLDMETENIFWRQVISMTDYFLTGEDEHRAQFHQYESVIVAQIGMLEASADEQQERDTLERLRSLYGQFSTTFDRAAMLYQAGRKEEAIQMDLSEIDPLEGRIEATWEELTALKRTEIESAVGEIRADKKYATVFPALSTMIENTEAIYTENQALQHALEAEENFQKQVVALTDLFVFHNREHIDEFHEYGEVFERELREGKSFAERADEDEMLRLIETKHRALSDTFNEVARIYEGGDKARALRIEMDKVDPAEDELAHALASFYPLKQQDMKQSLDNVVLVNATALSISKALGAYLFLTLIVGLFFGALGAIKITKPVKRLVKATQSIATGDFSARMEVKSGDEIGQLSRSFNIMAEALQGTTVSKDYMDSIIRSMADSLVVVSAAGRIMTVNAATCRMLGYTEDELRGQPLAMLFAPDEAAATTGADAHVSGETGVVNDVERTYLAKDGRSIPVSFSRSVLRGDSGQARETICMAKDITERKRAEHALRASEHKLSLHIQQTPLAVIEWNLKAEIVEWNPAAERVFGYQREEVIGRHIAGLLVPGSTRAQFDREWHNHISQKIGWHSLNENLTKDGRTIICDWYNTPLESERGMIGVASMVQDFTERTQMEEALKQARDAALESARLKSEFLANMSHEIRTPMNGVIGMTGILLDTELDAEQRDFAETIRSSGDALLTIINDILDFSKIEAGKLHFETLDFDLRNAVEIAIELLAERAHGKNIELASLILSDTPTGLRGDPGRLRQVLTNLIGNALKFTEQGEVTVRAEKESETGESVVIRFLVSDTGIGISEAAQRNLFQAFVQADGSTTRKYGGTGLGLAISKQLVGLMGGEIGVTSTEGQGSTFWFTARFEKQPESNVVVAHTDAPSLNRVRCLIVDDSATNRKILSHQLGSWGMIHAECGSAERALELLRAAAASGEAYGLAVLDLMMPGMDGLELARAIKTDPDIAGVRLVLLTSFGERGHEATALRAGVAAYLTKPVRQSQLFECLTGVIGRASGRREPAAAITGPGAANPATRPALQVVKQSSNKLILLAEDNIVNQKVAALQLQKLGYRADTVANGRETLEALSRIPYDLVLMDCQMPEMDGYEATAEIRRREGPGKHTPIVAMTAHALETDRAKCIAAGMDDYISKPVKSEELKLVLERVWSDTGQNREATGAISVAS